MPPVTDQLPPKRDSARVGFTVTPAAWSSPAHSWRPLPRYLCLLRRFWCAMTVPTRLGFTQSCIIIC